MAPAVLLAGTLWLLGLWAQDDAARQKLEEFRAALKKARQPQEFVSALQELGKLQHPKIFEELKGWLGRSGSAEIRMEAATQIGRYKEKEAAELLLAASAKQKEAEVTVRMMAAAGETGRKEIAGKLISLYHHKNDQIARQAMTSSGKIGSKDCIEPLLRIVRDNESLNEPERTDGAEPGDYLENEKMRRKKVLLPAALSALVAITGLEHATAAEWEAWWKKNKATFKEK